MTTYHRPTVRTAAAAALAVAGLGLAGCAAEDPEPSTDAGAEELLAEEPVEPYSGPYDEEFVQLLDAYVGEDVELVGEVGEIVSPVAFTVTTEDSAVPPLLVVHEPEAAAVEVGSTVQLAGTLHEAYNVPTVEEELGQDPGPEVLASYDGQPFVNATAVDVVAADEASPAA